MNHEDHQLYPLAKSTGLLGDLSIWTLRKHISRGNVKATRLGRRVFLSSAEIARIQHEGLPSLSDATGPRTDEAQVSTAQRKNRARALPGDARDSQR
jgi:hypothetical protein